MATRETLLDDSAVMTFRTAWPKFLLLLALVLACPLAAGAKVVPEAREQVSFSFAPVVKQVAPAVVNIYTRKVVEQRSSPFFADPFFRRSSARIFRRRARAPRPDITRLGRHRRRRGHDRDQSITWSRGRIRSPSCSPTGASSRPSWWARTSAPTLRCSTSTRMASVSRRLSSPTPTRPRWAISCSPSAIPSGSARRSQAASSPRSPAPDRHQRLWLFHPDRRGDQPGQFRRRPRRPWTASLSASTPRSSPAPAGRSASASPSRRTWCALCCAEKSGGKLVRAWFGAEGETVSVDIAEAARPRPSDGGRGQRGLPGRAGRPAPASSTATSSSRSTASAVDDAEAFGFASRPSRSTARPISRSPAGPSARADDRADGAARIGAPRTTRTRGRLAAHGRDGGEPLARGRRPARADLRKGVVVVQVPAQRLANLGVKPGDIILRVNGADRRSVQTS